MQNWGRGCRVELRGRCRTGCGQTRTNGAHDQLEPENIAAVSNYVRSAAGVVGATDLIELKASPEFAPPADAPPGTFVEICDSDTQAIYDAIWTRLKK